MKESKDIANFYKKKQVESASPGRLIVMLYDKCLEHLNTATEYIEVKSPNSVEIYHNSLMIAQKIITELTVALDMDRGGEVAKNLFRLYDFMNYRLMDANVKREKKAIIEVVEVMEILKSGWVDIQDTPITMEEEKSINKGLNIQG